MVRAISLLAVLIFATAGCVTLDKPGELALILSAQNLAYTIAKDDPDVIEPGLIILKSIEEGRESDEYAQMLSAWLINKYQGKPLMVVNIMAIMDSVTVQGEINTLRLRIAAKGAIQGLELVKMERAD